MSYMLNHDRLPKWKKCLGCGYCHDENGNNNLTKQYKGEADEPDQKSIEQNRSKTET